MTVRKPWGREVWYSGVEERGESRVHHGGERIPLSRFLATQGRGRPVTLLKTLHPDAGNLYVEVHERKHEVYIVDTVDAERWPDAGRMLLGASIERSGLDEVAFREHLLAKALAAEASCRVDGVAALMRAVPLQVGDAVAIAPRVPHSLLRGVNVVEFQTPVFERKILAASQRVATQTGWDSAEAVDLIDLKAKPRVTSPNGEATQTLGSSDTFTVTRHRLAAGATLSVAPWSVGWVVDGELRHDAVAFGTRSAWITPEAAELCADGACETLVAHER
ncbi:MAG: hypothetical protein OXH15_06360 [Gammaproteobacteria bacterium]|nr:hypothetical protein [Gammaproteobacteria bacterium]